VRTNDKMRGPSGAGFARNNSATAKFNVIRMRAKGQRSGTGVSPVRW